MKTLILLLVTLTALACSAKDWAEEKKDEQQQAMVFINSLPEGACFTQTYTYKAELPWEISGPRQDGIYMVIKKASSGYLMAQKVPECEKRISCGYWVRSWTYSQNVFTKGLTRIGCPSDLNVKAMMKLIKTEYYDEFDLKKLGAK